MPLTLTLEQFNDGRRYVRTSAVRAVSAEDARAVSVRISVGGDLAGMPLLNVMAPGVELAPEARKIFAGISSASDQEKSMMAVVASSAPLRVLLSFVIRLAGMASRTKFFSSEPEAVSWLQTASP